MKRQELTERKQRIELEREKARLYYRGRFGMLSLIHPLQHRHNGLPGKGKDVLFDDLNPQERRDFTEIYGAFDFAYPLDHEVDMSALDRDKERALTDFLNGEEDPAAYLSMILGRMEGMGEGLEEGLEVLRAKPRRSPGLLPTRRRLALYRCFDRFFPNGERELRRERMRWAPSGASHLDK